MSTKRSHKLAAFSKKGLKCFLVVPHDQRFQNFVWYHKGHDNAKDSFLFVTYFFKFTFSFVFFVMIFLLCSLILQFQQPMPIPLPRLPWHTHTVFLISIILWYLHIWTLCLISSLGHEKHGASILTEAHFGPCQTSTMVSFAKLVNGFDGAFLRR